MTAFLYFVDRSQDHRNDVFSNAVAVTTSMLAHWHHQLWYMDSLGGLVISMYIAMSWLATGKEQVEKLVGLRTYSSRTVRAVSCLQTRCVQ